MTNEEFDEILERTNAVVCSREWYERAVKALEQEPCEDCVSRTAVLEYIEGSDAELGHSSENKLVCQDIKEFPPVTPTKCIATVKFSKEDIQELIDEKMKDIAVERKKGKWVEVWDKDHIVILAYKCSECGIMRNTKKKYCADCGAEMESEE